MDKLKTPAKFDLEYFFEITPDLLCIVGFDGYFKKINPAVSFTLGYTEQELLDAPIGSFIHPEDQEISNQKLTRLISGKSLLNFENRYLTKDGSIIWLYWTSIPDLREQLVFSIAKDVTYRKRLEEYDRISSILEMINEHHKKFRQEPKFAVPLRQTASSPQNTRNSTDEHTQADQLWLNNFEMIVRRNAGQLNLSLALISSELALSQRQLFRRVNDILNITPNKLVRVIRLQMAWEAIASGKYRTIKEISHIAGYSSRTHFSKLFKEVYGIHVSDLL